MTSLKNVLLAEDKSLVDAYEDTFAKREMALLFRSLRKKAGLTQTQLAQRTGLSQPQISSLESATGGLPELETCSRYFHGCGVRLKLSPFAESFETVDDQRELCVVL